MLPYHLDAVAHFIGYAGHVSETGNFIGAVAVPVSVLLGFNVFRDCSPEGVIDAVDMFFASSEIKDKSVGMFTCKKPFFGNVGEMDNASSGFSS